MKRIMLITTGGTIACTNTSDGLRPVKSGAELLSLLPSLPDNLSIEIKEICNFDSTDMTKEFWLLIVATIKLYYDKFDGFIITHGTDTLSFTAAALYCLIKNCPKPIILTGSQLPATEPGSDAIANLTNAINCAIDNSFSGVNIVFGNRVIDGSCAKKMHTTDFNAFVSINRPYIATINPDGSIIKHNSNDSFAKNNSNKSFTEIIPEDSSNESDLDYPESNSQPTFYDKLSEDVAIVTLTPGIMIDTIKPILDIKKCILLETFGVGGIPLSMYRDLTNLFSSDEYSEKFLLIGTQVPYGGTNVDIYRTGKRLHNKIPFIETGTLTLEMSFVKMMWALAYADDFKTIKELFEKQ